MGYTEQLITLLEESYYKISNKEPSEWAEERMTISKGKFQGPLRFETTPYSREILDCLSPYHYSTEVVVQGGAQWGKTTSIIEPAIAYYISEHPCDMGYLTGHTDLSDESMDKLDNAIDNAGLRDLIKDPSLRKNKRSGDTIKAKKFPLGSLVSGSATNHKLLRQRSWRFIVADDIEAAKGASKESGSTVALIRERAKSFGKSKKILWVSTPELKDTSIIEPLFQSGDQRLWHWPCPCCGEMIVLSWAIKIDGQKETAGFTWKLDSADRLIPSSVGYICQKCGEFFNEKNKYELNTAAKWIATAEPEEPTIVSFKLPSFYATPGMNDWEDAVRQYIKANPPGQPQKSDLMKTLVNLTWGEAYEGEEEAPKSTLIMGNCRSYPINTIPEKQSIADGNGKIIMLTCACDMNGKMEGFHKATEDDVRLDWEIVAHAESGATYSVCHGSIGTFKPGADPKEDRVKWTYEENKPNCVWPELDKIINAYYHTDTERKMQVLLTGLDTGNYTTHAYTYLNKRKNIVIGLKGEKEDTYTRAGLDKALFKTSVERGDLFILQVGKIKDTLSEYMGLRWDEKEPQPANFMNFPQPSGGLYGYSNYFQHFESEARSVITNRDGTTAFIWKKTKSNNQNHFWDCRVYNLAIRDIAVHLIGKEHKRKDLTWAEFVTLFK